MLNVKMGGCTDCADLKNLICQIDTKIFYYSKNRLNNIRLLTALDFNAENMDLLITYKRVLSNKIFNPNYCCEVNLATILSRVKILLNK